MIIFDNLWKLMKTRNIPESYLKHHGITDKQLQALRNNDDLQVSTRLIEKLCVILNCTPQDIMENRLHS